MKKLIYIFFLGCIAVLNAQNAIDDLLKKYNNNSVPYISIDDLKAQHNAIILDAREPAEYNVSHIQNALLVGYDHFDLKKTINQLKDKKQTVIVYCSIGVRSENIAYKLKKAGYKNVFNLYGGIFEWKNNNNPVFDNTEKETEKVHVCSRMWGKYLLKGEKMY